MAVLTVPTYTNTLRVIRLPCAAENSIPTAALYAAAIQAATLHIVAAPLAEVKPAAASVKTVFIASEIAAAAAEEVAAEEAAAAQNLAVAKEVAEDAVSVESPACAIAQVVPLRVLVLVKATAVVPSRVLAAASASRAAAPTAAEQSTAAAVDQSTTAAAGEQSTAAAAAAEQATAAAAVVI